MNWLFPERVGKKYKAERSLPLNGEHVVDIDSYLVLFKNNHKVDDHWFVCGKCLDMAKRLTLQLCEVIQKCYSKIAVVFSGCAGFHTHVFDRRHFTVSVDPIRIVTVPNMLNRKTGLICRFLGTPKDLELLSIFSILGMSKPFFVHGYPEAPEPSTTGDGCNGPVKSCAKNLG